MHKSTPNSSHGAVLAKSAAGSDFRKKTDFENKKMDIAFNIYKLDQEAEIFVEKRYLTIKNICQKLSSGNRSV